MTSSLVGSEMCIRDSELEAQRLARHLGRSEAVPLANLEGLLPRAGARACLLYTSDAADDM
eukprot:10936481-Prorocentrum_lima.AAC.1